MLVYVRLHTEAAFQQYRAEVQPIYLQSSFGLSALRLTN